MLLHSKTKLKNFVFFYIKLIVELNSAFRDGKRLSLPNKKFSVSKQKIFLKDRFIIPVQQIQICLKILTFPHINSARARQWLLYAKEKVYACLPCRTFIHSSSTNTTALLFTEASGWWADRPVPAAYDSGTWTVIRKIWSNSAAADELPAATFLCKKKGIQGLNYHSYSQPRPLLLLGKCSSTLRLCQVTHA